MSVLAYGHSKLTVVTPVETSSENGIRSFPAVQVTVANEVAAGKVITGVAYMAELPSPANLSAQWPQGDNCQPRG